MRPLSASELLTVWEQGLAQPACQRALMLLAAASPESALDTLAQLSLGERDARLLTLREWTFGPQLVSFAVCPHCRERLELTINVADLRGNSPSPASVQGTGRIESGPLTSGGDDYQVSFRLPNSLDLGIAAGSDVAALRTHLLERCTLRAERNGIELPPTELPEAVADAVMTQMEQADPFANVKLPSTCPACDRTWLALFDIGAFFWSEINAWAWRILRQVHTLATAYGWRESDILSMSPWRREAYLGMIGT